MWLKSWSKMSLVAIMSTSRLPVNIFRPLVPQPPLYWCRLDGSLEAATRANGDLLSAVLIAIRRTARYHYSRHGVGGITWAVLLSRSRVGSGPHRKSGVGPTSKSGAPNPNFAWVPQALWVTRVQPSWRKKSPSGAPEDK